MKEYRRYVAGLLVLSLSGCASIMGKSGPQSIRISSTPGQAEVVIIDQSSGERVFEGKTPTIVPLQKKQGYFSGKKYTVTISKEGYQPQEVEIRPRAGGWYLFGNLVFGAFLGWLIVDPATGAMWTLTPDKVHEDLSAHASSKVDSGVKVVLLEDVPVEMRGSMVPLPVAR